MKNKYVPLLGDIVWFSFDPTLGQEQGGRRPSLILSPKTFNDNGMCVLCPITSRIKGLRFEVAIDYEFTQGAILSSQIKCLDWRRRNPIFIEKCPPRIMTVVKLKIALLLGIDENLLSLLS